ncbi:hypothetical protein Tco_1526487, partial [Tanacetum coccineum]
LLKLEQHKQSLNDFTDELFKTTSSPFSPSPLREATTPRDPAKGKGVADEVQGNALVPFQSEGGSDPKMPKLKSFTTPEVAITKEEFEAELLEENVVVDGSQRNITHPLGINGKGGMVIKEPMAGFFYLNGNCDLVFQRASEFHITSIVQLIRLQRRIIKDSLEAEEMYQLMNLEIESRDDVVKARETVEKNLDGLASNPGHIQVQDIVKEVEDHLKTYSSAGMDISWYVEGIRCGSKKSQGWQYSDYPVTL